MACKKPDQVNNANSAIIFLINLCSVRVVSDNLSEWFNFVRVVQVVQVV